MLSLQKKTDFPLIKLRSGKISTKEKELLAETLDKVKSLLIKNIALCDYIKTRL